MEPANKPATSKRDLLLNAVIVGTTSIFMHYMTDRFGLTAGLSYAGDLLLRGVLVVAVAVPAIYLKDYIRR